MDFLLVLKDLSAILSPLVTATAAYFGWKVAKAFMVKKADELRVVAANDILTNIYGVRTSFAKCQSAWGSSEESDRIARLQTPIIIDRDRIAAGVFVDRVNRWLFNSSPGFYELHYSSLQARIWFSEDLERQIREYYQLMYDFYIDMDSVYRHNLKIEDEIKFAQNLYGTEKSDLRKQLEQAIVGIENCLIPAINKTWRDKYRTTDKNSALSCD